MPKDPTKNVDRYKIRGGTLNEFELDQNQEAYAQQQAQKDANLIPGTPPEQKVAAKAAKKTAAKTTRKAATKTTKKAAKKAAQATKSTKQKTVATRGASAKKLAARKAAKKR